MTPPDMTWRPDCRFVVILSDQRGYFFWLFVAYTGFQAWLALLALLHHPGGSSVEANDDTGYVVCSLVASMPALPRCKACCEMR